MYDCGLYEVLTKHKVKDTVKQSRNSSYSIAEQPWHACLAMQGCASRFRRFCGTLPHFRRR